MARREGHYYWRFSNVEGELSRGSVSKDDELDFARVILEDEAAADRLIEEYDRMAPDDLELGSAVLYKDGRKVKEGFDVLYEDTGLTDFG